MTTRYKTCPICGKPFTGHFNTKFCGDDCQKQFKRTYEKAYRQARKKPEETETYEPFPAHLDRQYFGNWLSGFADGEATFVLRTIRSNQTGKINCSAMFRITLRNDEIPALKMIQSYWECGKLYFSDNSRSKIHNAKPIASFSVQKVADLANVIVPHFDRFPLLAKKRHDFAIWKRGIELMTEIQGRPLLGRLELGGIEARWSSEDRGQFDQLIAELVDQRRYAP